MSRKKLDKTSPQREPVTEQFVSRVVAQVRETILHEPQEEQLYILQRIIEEFNIDVEWLTEEAEEKKEGG